MDQTGLLALGDGQVESFAAGVLDVGASGVEVRVVGYDVAFFDHYAEQDALGGAALVSRDDVLVTEDILHRIAETDVAAASGVALVAFHDRAPLEGGHRARARVGQQIYEDIVGREQEQVVVRLAQELFAFGARGPADGLDTVDTERLDDGADRHSAP